MDSLFIDEIWCKMTFWKAENNVFNGFYKKTKKLVKLSRVQYLKTVFFNKQRIDDYLKFDTFFAPDLIL